MRYSMLLFYIIIFSVKIVYFFVFQIVFLRLLGKMAGFCLEIWRMLFG